MKTKIFWICLIQVSILINLYSAQIATGELNNVIELNLTGPLLSSKDAPAKIIDLWLEFKHSDGTIIKVWGYWNGSNSYKVRFCPIKTGTWTIINTYSNQSSLNNQLEGDYIIANSSTLKGHWFTDGTWFKRADGSHQYIVGNTFYDFLSKPNGNETSSDKIKNDIYACANYFKKVRICVMSFRTENKGSLLPFYNSDGITQSDRCDNGNGGRINPIFFIERVDAAVKSAFEKDLIVDLILGGTTGDQMGEDYDFLRYMAARYSAFPNVWFCLGNEVQEQESASSVISTGDYIKSFLSYNNPLSAHVYNSSHNGNWLTHGAAFLKASTISSSADYMKKKLSEIGNNKPIINDENGYDPGEMSTNGVIQGITGSFLGGGYGSTGNKTGDKSGGYFWGHAALGKNITDHPSIDELKYLSDVINTNITFWKMKPVSSSIFSNTPSNSKILEWTGNQYVIGTSGTANITANLPSGTWKVMQFDIMTKTTKTLTTSASGNYNFTTSNSLALLTFFVTSSVTNPFINLSIKDILININKGETISNKIISVSNSGGGTLNWSSSVLPSVTWLTLINSSGTNNGTIEISFNVSTLTEGKYSTKIIVNGNASNSPQEISIVLNILGDVPPVIITKSSDLGTGYVGKPYSDDLEAIDGTAPFTWSIISGTLPPGLTIIGKEITGTPITKGIYTFNVVVQDSKLLSDTVKLDLIILDEKNVLKINFQPTSSLIPTGFIADYGKPFIANENGYSYGWNNDQSALTRDRKIPGISPEKNTLCHFKGKIWEIGLTNGTYNLSIFCGDASYIDQNNSLNVEGLIINDPDGQDNFDEYLNVKVQVNDGRLTIKESNSTNNSKICYLYIQKDSNLIVPVSGVSINNTSLSIVKGESAQLIASVLPNNATNKAVTWSSNNSAIASVNNSGLINAIAEGNATITVTTIDGNKSATCNVNVTISTDIPDNLIVSVSDNSSATYLKATGLSIGTKYYVDRDFTITSIPSEVNGAEFIKTANNDKKSTLSNLLTFTLSAQSNIFIAFDSRAISFPLWMNEFTTTGISIITTDVTLKLFTKILPAGTYTLGGANLPSGSNYFVIATPVNSLKNLTSTDEYNLMKNRINLFPCPAKSGEYISINENYFFNKIIITNITGINVSIENIDSKTFKCPELPSGIYVLTLISSDQIVDRLKLIVK